jgi:hypothetical protein
MNVWQRRRRGLLVVAAQGAAQLGVVVVVGGEPPHQRLLDILRATLVEIARLPLIDLPQREIFRPHFRQIRFEVGHFCGTALALFCL